MTLAQDLFLLESFFRNVLNPYESLRHHGLMYVEAKLFDKIFPVKQSYAAVHGIKSDCLAIDLITKRTQRIQTSSSSRSTSGEISALRRGSCCILIFENSIGSGRQVGRQYCSLTKKFKLHRQVTSHQLEALQTLKLAGKAQSMILFANSLDANDTDRIMDNAVLSRRRSQVDYICCSFERGVEGEIFHPLAAEAASDAGPRFDRPVQSWHPMNIPPRESVASFFSFLSNGTQNQSNGGLHYQIGMFRQF